MNQALALTPAASAAAASTAIRVEVRNLTVTGPDIQSLLSAVQFDMELVPDMTIDSDDMAAELMGMLGRLATVSAAIEAERKERTAPLLAAQKWLMGGYSPASTALDALIASGKAKLTAYNRAIAEKKHLVVEAGTGVGKSFAYLVPAILAATADQVKDANRVQHPVPHRMRLFRVCHNPEKQDRDRHDEQDERQVRYEKNNGEQNPGTADGHPGLHHVLKHRPRPR